MDRARAERVPVIWVQHADENLPQGSPPWHWVPELVPAADERLIHKAFNSAFEQTGLESTLASLGVTHIVLAGAATNWRIRATAYAALERGYDLTLVSDAHTTETMKLESGVTIAATDVVQELNIAMTWLAYPGRRNTAPRLPPMSDLRAKCDRSSPILSSAETHHGRPLMIQRLPPALPRAMGPREVQ